MCLNGRFDLIDGQWFEWDREICENRRLYSDKVLLIKKTSSFNLAISLSLSLYLKDFKIFLACVPLENDKEKMINFLKKKNY